MPNSKIDITGMRSGTLTAREPHGKDSSGTTLWLCDCDCGKTTIVRGTRLRKQETKSCGGKGHSCQRRKIADLTNRRFGNLLVKSLHSRVIRNGTSEIKWLCVCDCGTEKICSSQSLKIGRFPACRECRLARLRHLSQFTVCRSSEYILLHSAKRRAKLQGLPFNLCLEDIQIPKTCPLLGIPIRSNKKTISPNSPTLDKIIPSKGYVKGNVWVISQKANKMKSNMSIFDMRNFADIIEDKISQLSPKETTNR